MTDAHPDRMVWRDDMPILSRSMRVLTKPFQKLPPRSRDGAKRSDLGLFAAPPRAPELTGDRGASVSSLHACRHVPPNPQACPDSGSITACRQPRGPRRCAAKRLLLLALRPRRSGTAAWQPGCLRVVRDGDALHRAVRA